QQRPRRGRCTAAALRSSDAVSRLEEGEGEVSLCIAARALAAAGTQQWRLPVRTATLQAPATFWGPRRTTFTNRHRAAACKVGADGVSHTLLPSPAHVSKLVGKDSLWLP
ncbi:hypothetical protein XENOCAPTIV_004774, partial [Xenoophorus captivus]